MRRNLFLIMLVVCVAAASVASVSQASDSESVKRDDPVEGSVLDIIGTELKQRDHTLTLGARFASGAADSLATAGDGSSVCFAFERGRVSRTICVRYEGGKLKPTRGGRPLSATVKTSGDRLIVRASDSRLKLKPGVYDLVVTARAGVCGSETPEVPCVDRAPDRRAYRVRVWRVAVTGCVSSGVDEVFRGPRVKKVALTYDDGPGVATESILRTLDRHDAKATFFVLGGQVGGKGPRLRKALRAGHEIGNHGFHHSLMGGGGESATSELAATQRAVRKATGFTPCVFRPVFGSTGSDLRRRARALGLSTINWTVDPFDWRSPGTGAIVNRVLSAAGPGSIVLLHDGGGARNQTAAATGPIVRSLRRRGYKLVTVSELMDYGPVTTLTRR